MNRVVAAGLIAGLLSCHEAFGLLAEHPDGPVSAAQWQDGWADLINDKARVYGYFLNWSDHFYFSGDALTCSEFLGRYAALSKKGDMILISRGPGVIARFFREENVAYDWEVAMTGGTHITVTIHPGGKIKLGDLVVPATLQVKASSPLDSVKLDTSSTAASDAEWERELAAFLAKHAARQAEFNQK